MSFITIRRETISNRPTLFQHALSHSLNETQLPQLKPDATYTCLL